MSSSVSIDSYIKSPLPIIKELNYFFSETKDLIIFDVGACEAEDSIRYSLLFPSATIHSFEPVPENVEKGLNNILRWKRKNILLNNFALADKEGEMNFYLSEGHPENIQKSSDWDYGNKSSSLLQPHLINHTHKWLNFNNQIIVKTKSIDEYCNNNNLEKIDFLHIDVQGGELIVLSGANKMLKKTGMIWMEVENMELYRNQPLRHEVENFMKIKGFTKIKDTIKDISGDQLYINSKYFQLNWWGLFIFQFCSMLDRIKIKKA